MFYPHYQQPAEFSFLLAHIISSLVVRVDVFGWCLVLDPQCHSWHEIQKPRIYYPRPLGVGTRADN
jgi:hypothetical protein